MKEEIKVPAMGESISEATVGSFLKATGAFVREGEEIVELETEKVNQVLYSSATGTLKWSVQEGDTVKIGQRIGEIDKEGKEEKVKEERPLEKERPSLKNEAAPSPKQEGRIFSKDLVEELTSAETPREKQVQRIEKPQESSRETRTKMTKIRKVISTRLKEALHNAAMLTTFNEVDMTHVMDLRARNKESFLKKHGVKLGLMSFFVKAVVESLKAIPHLNSYIEGEDIVQRNYYDIGIAVSTERGLVVPVLRDCDNLSFGEIEQKIAEYAKKAREGGLKPDDLQGGGFTITNGGVFGSLLSTPLLNPPQSGILGMHKIDKRAVVVNDQIVIRPMMYLALSYDHRIVDGKEAISFLVGVKEVIEDPSRLLFMDNTGDSHV